MIAGVADTHMALGHVFDDKRLSAVAGNFIDQAAAARRTIVPVNAYADLRNARQIRITFSTRLHFTVEIVDAMRGVLRAEVPDLPDRIVAATAVYFGVPVISRESRIRAASLQTVW